MTQPTNHPVPDAAKLTDALLTCADWDDPVDVAYKVSEAASQYTYDYCRQPLPAKIQARIAELEAHVQEVDDDGDDFPYVKGNAIGMLNGFRECAELVAHSQPEEYEKPLGQVTAQDGTVYPSIGEYIDDN